MKKYIFLAILLIIGGGAYYLATNLESIVKKVVHKYGSEVTGTDVNIDGFKLSLKEGTGTISKITVANPAGYKVPNLFELNEITVKVDLKSITTDTIIIESININKPVITYEMLSLTKNNISDIQNTIQNYLNKAPKKSVSKETAKTEAKEEKASKNVTIKKSSVENGELGAYTNIQGLANNVTVKLPPIQMTNVGGEGNGKEVGQIVSEVISIILNTASKTAVNSNFADIEGVAKENLDNAVSSAKERVSETKDILKNLGKF